MRRENKIQPHYFKGPEYLIVGLDIGSTTVKGVVADIQTNAIIWSDYRRHETRVAEKVLEFLQRIENDLELRQGDFRLFITGSGASGLTEILGGKFVQEVNALSLAVEKFHPQVKSVIELGGQDAKIIVFKEDSVTGVKKKNASMNDKCAGGTGSVIDKIAAKLNIAVDELCQLPFKNVKIHPVAGKCGVFAETDINSLQKQGVPNNELIASLYNSIVQQNLTVLTRGHTLLPEVLLLGGPNTFLRGMVEAWQANLPSIWKERGIEIPNNSEVESLIKVPKNSELYAAIGAVEYGKGEPSSFAVYQGWQKLYDYVHGDREELKSKLSGSGLCKSHEEIESFRKEYQIPEYVQPEFAAGEIINVFIGVDGGSTSTKAVLLDGDKNLIAQEYRLSKGNPIEDTKEILDQLRLRIESQGAKLNVLGAGVTGYAKDILKDVIGADVALVETVAHTMSALHYFDDIDVICDVGGQDIKIIILKDRRVVDFKLNTQCSAGNGYFLQATAESLGYRVEDYAENAFKANRVPEFSYGCAVFLQSDIVDFQRQGWKPEEILAGLVKVLPKNIWLYIAQMPNVAKFGRHFILQGGTQHNLAAVKAQVDFIEERFKGLPEKPVIKVHPHTGVSGAIGVAIESARLYIEGKQTNFIGFDAVRTIKYKSTRDEETRCFYCKNHCLRTFIDIYSAPVHENGIENVFSYRQGAEQTRSGRVEYFQQDELEKIEGVRRERIIIATCEKGAVDNLNGMKEVQKNIEDLKKANPNLVEFAGKKVWQSVNPKIFKDEPKKFASTPKTKLINNLKLNRDKIVIGIPRLLNLYTLNPFFSAYFESLGIFPGNIVYSDFTSEQLYRDGAKRGNIDPCYPSKLAIPHIHNLLYVQHKKKKLNYIFFPSIDSMPSDLLNCVDHRGCPTAVATPFSVKAAFTKEADVFGEFGVQYINPFLNLLEPELAEKQLFDELEMILGLTKSENKKAVAEGFKVFKNFQELLHQKGREVLELIERENRIGIVVLARPYHNDPGINHGILEEFQKLGYPILFQDSLPTDDVTLNKYFRDEDVSPLEIRDVWKNSFSENTNRKIWAAKFAARHPNLVVLELSNFRCGHDAPVYSLIQEIVEASGTPYFCFKDIDENKPKGSIKIRIETITYFLKRYSKHLQHKEISDMVEELKPEVEEVFSVRNY
jgi:predicted CoA-substrate-specific enzyme activase